MTKNVAFDGIGMDSFEIAGNGIYHDSGIEAELKQLRKAKARRYMDGLTSVITTALDGMQKAGRLTPRKPAHKPDAISAYLRQTGQDAAASASTDLASILPALGTVGISSVSITSLLDAGVDPNTLAMVLAEQCGVTASDPDAAVAALRAYATGKGGKDTGMDSKRPVRLPVGKAGALDSYLAGMDSKPVTGNALTDYLSGARR